MLQRVRGNELLADASSQRSVEGQRLYAPSGTTDKELRGEVLEVGTCLLPDRAGRGRIRITLSTVNRGDTEKRPGRLGLAMPFPRVVNTPMERA